MNWFVTLVPLMETVGFVNIEPGIKDPSVFDIPKECEEVCYPFFFHSAVTHIESL